MLKQKEFILLLIIIFCLINTQVFSGNNNEKKTSIYKVKAEITELKNRTLECKVRNHTVLIDQPREFGADDKAPTPPEMLAISLGSCVASTIQFVAYQRNIKITNIRVKVEGEIDFSKAMGISTKKRAGYSGLEVTIKFDSEMKLKEKQKFIDDVFELGAAIDNIQNKTAVKYNIIE